MTEQLSTASKGSKDAPWIPRSGVVIECPAGHNAESFVLMVNTTTGKHIAVCLGCEVAGLIEVVQTKPAPAIPVVQLVTDSQHPVLKPGVRRTLLAMAGLAEPDGSGICVSSPTLAGHLGISDMTAQQHRRKLEQAGLIVRTAEPWGRRPAVYDIVINALSNMEPER